LLNLCKKSISKWQEWISWGKDLDYNKEPLEVILVCSDIDLCNE